MDKAELVKLGIEFFTSMTVGTVVGNGLKSIEPVGQTRVNKILSVIGGYVISGILHDHAEKWLKNKIVEVIDTAQDLTKSK